MLKLHPCPLIHIEKGRDESKNRETSIPVALIEKLRFVGLSILICQVKESENYVPLQRQKKCSFILAKSYSPWLNYATLLEIDLSHV